MADPLGPLPPAPEDPPEQPADPAMIVMAAGLFYALMIGGGCLWLWLRDRIDQLPATAGGTWGLPVSLMIGTACGLAASGVCAVLVRYLGPFARREQQLAQSLGPMTETQITILALLSSVAEEFFFRMAMQDALGTLGTAAVFALLHAGPRGQLLWAVLAFLFGLVLGGMVESGCGLLGVTVAHALINYLSLRRMVRR